MGFIKNLISKFRRPQQSGPNMSIPYELLEDGVAAMNYNGSLFTSEDDVMWRYEGEADNSAFKYDLYEKGLLTMHDIERYFIVRNFPHNSSNSQPIGGKMQQVMAANECLRNDACADEISRPEQYLSSGDHGPVTQPEQCLSSGDHGVVTRPEQCLRN